MINLKDIKKPSDLNNLSLKDLELLSKEIRTFLLKNISSTGGHLSSNLGVVELTLALHKSFDSPNDKIIWDVGHQAYVHKILTGRQDKFSTLRQLDGMSGFLKSSESEHDVFEAGHSSTSISAAIGYSKAFKLKGTKQHAIAVIGDGALTGGVAFEALNYAGHSDENVIVVLNDNEMSISGNVGAMSTYLTKVRTTKTYYDIKMNATKLCNKIPIVGKPLLRASSKMKNSLKQLLLTGMLFEEFGFTYVGVVDGHNIKKLMKVMDHIKDINGPVLLHVSTKKGKGYKFSEEKPEKYHGVSKFNINEGVKVSSSSNKYQDILGSTLCKMASQDKEMVAITAAMPSGTGLVEFSKRFPNQFIDVGIAEQNAVLIAAGLAKEGIKPYVCIYSTFLQRAYDQIVHDICIQNLDVVFCIDRAGLVGQDGETHQGIFDLSYLSHIPHMTVLAPKDKTELVAMLHYSKSHKGPLAIRYPRGNAMTLNNVDLNNNNFETLNNGTDCVIVAVGKMVESAIEAEKLLREKSINATIINPRQVFPIQEKLVELVNDFEHVFTIEDNVLNGGFGATLEINSTKKITKIALPNQFIEHGAVDELYKRYNMDAVSIANTVISNIEGR